MPKDYYGILGVEREASAEEIKRAFRRLARENHPDANPGDPAADGRFRQIAEAYEVLSDPERRRVYDRGGQVDLGDLFGGMGGFDDLLRSVFGDSGLFGSGRAGAPRGRDILARVNVDLHDAAFGTDAEVAFRTLVECEECRGSGARPGTDFFTCPTCNGAGAVRVARRGLLGTVMSVTQCDTCAGRGEVVSDPCEQCRGEGVHEADRTVKVEIPQGVDTGTRLRLSREGEAAPRRGQAGDLYVEISVAPDSRFERAGDDLVHRTRVGIADAALGTTVDVPLVDGGIERVHVPAGTQPGWVQRIGGRGMGRLGRRGRGDLLVEVDVAVPGSLTAEQRDLLERFRQTGADGSGGADSPGGPDRAGRRRRGR